MAEKIPPRFRKTKTEKWAVMAPIEDLEKALAEGGKIDVQKKSGDWSSFVVASLGKPFDVDGVQMCYGYGPGDEDQGGSSGGGGRTRNADSPPPARGPDSDPWLSKNRDYDQQPDSSEPIPEYQGGAEDEWQEF
jgi:hypothetical protein